MSIVNESAARLGFDFPFEKNLDWEGLFFEIIGADAFIDDFIDRFSSDDSFRDSTGWGDFPASAFSDSSKGLGDVLSEPESCSCSDCDDIGVVGRLRELFNAQASTDFISLFDSLPDFYVPMHRINNRVFLKKTYAMLVLNYLVVYSSNEEVINNRSIGNGLDYALKEAHRVFYTLNFTTNYVSDYIFSHAFKPFAIYNHSFDIYKAILTKNEFVSVRYAIEESIKLHSSYSFELILHHLEEVIYDFSDYYDRSYELIGGNGVNPEVLCRNIGDLSLNECTPTISAIICKWIDDETCDLLYNDIKNHGTLDHYPLSKLKDVINKISFAALLVLHLGYDENIYSPNVETKLLSILDSLNKVNIDKIRNVRIQRVAPIKEINQTKSIELAINIFVSKFL